MKQVVISNLLGITTFLISNAIYARHVVYSIEYSKSSVKGPALESAEIPSQVFKNGTPAGFIRIKPNSNKQFTIPNDYGSNVAIAAFSIKGQGKLHLKCHGNAYPGKRKLVMECSRK